MLLASRAIAWQARSAAMTNPIIVAAELLGSFNQGRSAGFNPREWTPRQIEYRLSGLPLHQGCLREIHSYAGSNSDACCCAVRSRVDRASRISGADRAARLHARVLEQWRPSDLHHGAKYCSPLWTQTFRSESIAISDTVKRSRITSCSLWNAPLSTPWIEAFRCDCTSNKRAYIVSVAALGEDAI